MFHSGFLGIMFVPVPFAVQKRTKVGQESQHGHGALFDIAHEQNIASAHESNYEIFLYIFIDNIITFTFHHP